MSTQTQSVHKRTKMQTKLNHETDLKVKKPKRNIMCVVERSNGTTFRQLLDYRENESARECLARYKRMLGKSYWICDWWWVEESF